MGTFMFYIMFAMGFITIAGIIEKLTDLFMWRWF